MTRERQRSCIEQAHKEISITRQCALLGLPHASSYYTPREIDKEDLYVMKLIDKLYTRHPYYGNRRIKAELNKTHNIAIGRMHVRTLMDIMGLQALYPSKKQFTSIPDKSHEIYPYLLRNVAIEKPNHVWSTDITYIQLEGGFCYLIAIIDWYSRYVLGWKLSNSLDIDFVLECLKETLAQNHHRPEIFNTDQGSHFTSPRFTSILKEAQINISMDGRGRCLDNVFVERLWRSVKQEDIYLKDYSSIKDVRNGLEKYFLFYNTQRRHQVLDYETPRQIYFNL